MKFLISTGSYDGAEICDICALFILSELEKQKLNAIFGSYKDDGLALSRASARQTELIKKKICETFAKFGLKITIEANKKVVQFLDAEFDLRDESFKPFLKLGDTPQYVHVQSNHPPSILRNIPEAIQKRLSALSSDENKFNEAVPIYQEALNKSGYKFKLKYTPPTPTPDENKSKKKKRRRSRQVIWWNPPFSVNVKTNVGKIFFNLLKRHFPKEHPHHRIMNQNTVKMSYRTTPNMKNIISGHNAKILRTKKDHPCNCHKKRECPMPGECLKKDVIYQATVTPENSDLPTETYVGLTSNTIKQRISFHYSTFNYEHHEKSTALSKHIWSLKRRKVKYKISWKILDRAPSFCPIRGTCALCTLEKYYIIFKPSLASLNINEDFEPCRHKTPKLLDKT